MKRALLLAPEAVQRAPGANTRLAAALSAPFAVGLLDSARRAALLDVTLLGPDPSKCTEVLRPLEPYVPWTRSLLESRASCYRSHPTRWSDLSRVDRARYIRFE